MSRYDDLVRFCYLLVRLERKVGGKRRLKDCSGHMRWPRRGVYFFFEDGEERADTGQGPRVVRVGTHGLTPKADTKLWSRLRTHRGTQRTGGGSHRSSVFRVLIGTSLSRTQPDVAVSSWDEKRSADLAIRAKELVLEKRVTAVIREMPFLWVAVDDPPGNGSLRGTIERGAIALLSNYGCSPLDPPSPTWLGRDCYREDVRLSGLWNCNHVNETYDPAFLDAFETLVSAGEAI